MAFLFFGTSKTILVICFSNASLILRKSQRFQKCPIILITAIKNWYNASAMYMNPNNHNNNNKQQPQQYSCHSFPQKLGSNPIITTQFTPSCKTPKFIYLLILFILTITITPFFLFNSPQSPQPTHPSPNYASTHPPAPH